MNIKNKVGPRILPCGTPALIFDHEDVCPESTTLCCLDVKKSLIHRYNLPPIGREGVMASLEAGVNDLGGTLMNESITRAAGAEHGQEVLPEDMRAMIDAAGRRPRQRNTLYGDLERIEGCVA
jgi:2-iminoacetate synthase ThiH